ncbi:MULTISPECIES: UvrD-helicase domain-containing protein [Pseudomonadota]|jgi:DNA helicase-2/ATP-dependent DNA helicase PcrA|uniref:UvrD-helicase domain-containing protein n=1 Tax=Pseudomonadota TaxID=1224 RepID=UPI000459EA64|nr:MULTISPECIES: ATP-dependent helicase [Pseudomonadota]KCB29192.1 AAA protein [Bordetella hinzii CA90 BAL1384]MCS8146790.1 ATP-dependent helicase [Pseudomonas aeruginosa]MDI3693266.1 ATP-dependent helicase [Pseudomonas aeruginosa]QDJ36286.1 damage-inducible protein [Bordetella hinzii]TEP00790.1 ATP-dependent helicase [Pseudomonas aeruginosa]
MKLELCEKRKAVIAQGGHLLVLGGPGSGKTTIALLKAQRQSATLKPGQGILFLSFSRAAIRQVLLRCKEILTPAERRAVTVQTYHAFCMEILEAHGRLLHGRPIRFLYPGEERLQKSAFDGDWMVERRRLASEQGLYCFDLFAAGAADLLEGCAALRELIADRFPMIIVDEFQDTDDNQWRIVRALAEVTDVFCLADPEQRIFDYRDDIDPRRLDILREDIQVTEFDLGGENHRSPNAGILQFADAVLHNHSPLPATPDIKQVSYWQNTFAATVHAAVIWTFSALRKKGVEHPSVAVLSRSNSLIADLSVILSETHTYNKQTLPVIEHDVVWDAELSAAAAVVVASILEWPTGPAEETLARTLRVIAGYYKLKNAEEPTNAAAEHARKYDEAAAKVATGEGPRINAAKALVAVYKAGIDLVGEPVADWKAARWVLHDIPALNELFREARLVRLFRATDSLASGLGERWLALSSYAGASELVKRTLEQERLVAAERDPQGCILMNMHKAKGKEFDGVVLVEGAFKSSFFDERNEQPPFERSRRLLRVGLTRARTLVAIVRPQNARPLVD